jgi:plastocyanin
MKRIYSALFALIIPITFFQTSPVHATIHIIEVQNFEFTPDELFGVMVGDTVRWVWVNGFHTTTSKTIPGGAASWDSPISSSFPSFDYIVEVPGTYEYACTPHSPNMAGTFHVTQVSYTITAEPNDPDFGSVSGGGIYESGETVSLTATPATGYHFVNWTEDGNEVSTEENYIFIATGNRDLIANFILTVPNERFVQNIIIGNGEEECYDATETIYVNDFVVEAGGSAHFIAGINTIIEEGFMVEAGGYAWVRVSDEYCTMSKSIVAANKNVNPEPKTLITNTNSPFTVFPNPTSGLIYLEFPDVDETSEVVVEIYGIMGEQLLQQVFWVHSKHLIDLSGLPKGVYIIRGISGVKEGSEKLIKY